MMQKKPVFYCQLDYAHIPYPSPDNPAGTVADNGCGLCCSSMIAENILGQPFPLEENARFSIDCGARKQSGTNLFVYAPAFAERFGLTLTVTRDGAEALRFLQAGRGVIIANTGGDREGYIGVFSDSGHYIALISAEGDTVRVWDPMYRPGRYDKEGRVGKVRMDGNDAYADFSVIEQDCFERAYFLFSKREA